MQLTWSGCGPNMVRGTRYGVLWRRDGPDPAGTWCEWTLAGGKPASGEQREGMLTIYQGIQVGDDRVVGAAK